MKKRKPFIGKNIEYPEHCGRYSCHRTRAKQAGRLCVGAKFSWKGFIIKVTSFKDEGKSLVACAYKKKSLQYETCDKCGEKKCIGYNDKIEKRFTITHNQWRDEMKIRNGE